MIHNTAARVVASRCQDDSLDSRLTRLVLGAISVHKECLQLTTIDFLSSAELTAAVKLLRKAQYSVNVLTDANGFRTVVVRLELQ